MLQITKPVIYVGNFRGQQPEPWSPPPLPESTGPPPPRAPPPVPTPAASHKRRPGRGYLGAPSGTRAGPFRRALVGVAAWVRVGVGVRVPPPSEPQAPPPPAPGSASAGRKHRLCDRACASGLRLGPRVYLRRPHPSRVRFRLSVSARAEVHP